MSGVITASAPGKVVLAGEYAVLDGAPAICMAVNRRARVAMQTVAGDEGRITAPGFSTTVGRFCVADDALTWVAGRKSYALLDAAWHACAQRPAAAFDLVLNSSQFMDHRSGRKLGIGSSAAVTVALCAAINGANDVAAAAHKAHAILNGGSGSGVDVACSLQGGLIEYHREDKQSRQLRWPAGLEFRLVWTGVAVSTAAKLALLGTSAARPSRARLGRAAEALAMHWRGSDANAVAEGYADYVGHLQRFSDDYRLGIFDAGHAELLNTATSAGLIYKPCGAGGGDVGIVLGTDRDNLDAFIRKLPRQYAVIDCGMDRNGLINEEHE